MSFCCNWGDAFYFCCYFSAQASKMHKIFCCWWKTGDCAKIERSFRDDARRNGVFSCYESQQMRSNSMENFYLQFWDEPREKSRNSEQLLNASYRDNKKFMDFGWIRTRSFNFGWVLLLYPRSIVINFDGDHFSASKINSVVKMVFMREDQIWWTSSKMWYKRWESCFRHSLHITSARASSDPCAQALLKEKKKDLKSLA